MPGETTVVLVAAGEPSDALTAARVALAQAMKAAGGWRVIDGDAHAGARLDDGSIVARLRNTKADVIWILRVYPGAAGQPADAVVSVFARDGELRRAFAASEGTALAAAAGTGGGGVSSGTLQAIRSVDGGREAPSSDAEAAYLRERIHERQTTAMIVSQHGSAYIAAGPKLLYQGERMIEDGPDFYRTVGRADLAERYESTVDTQSTMRSIALPVMLLGAGLIPLAALGEEFDWTTAGIGIGAASAGLIMSFVALGMDPDPLAPSAKRQLIDAHNRELRAKHGLGEDPADAERRGTLRPRVGVTAGPDGGGLQLHMGF